MADWTTLPNLAVGVGGLPSGTTVTALRDNPVAIAEGAAGAPRIVGDALNLIVAEINPAGMSSVIITDLETSDFTLEFYTIQPDSTGDRTLFFDPSYDNGATFNVVAVSAGAISQAANYRDTGSNALGGLSGYFRSENTVPECYTGRPASNGLMSARFNDALFTIHSDKPFVPMNAFRLRWSTGSFGTDANQLIRFYQGGNRPFGGKP